MSVAIDPACREFIAWLALSTEIEIGAYAVWIAENGQRLRGEFYATSEGEAFEGETVRQQLVEARLSIWMRQRFISETRGTP